MKKHIQCCLRGGSKTCGHIIGYIALHNYRFSRYEPSPYCFNHREQIELFARADSNIKIYGLEQYEEAKRYCKRITNLVIIA